MSIDTTVLDFVTTEVPDILHTGKSELGLRISDLKTGFKTR